MAKPQRVYQVHMLTHAELDEDKDADLIAEREDEGRSSSVGDDTILIRATSEDEAKRIAEALPDYTGGEWYADQADDVFGDDAQDHTCEND